MNNTFTKFKGPNGPAFCKFSGHLNYLDGVWLPDLMGSSEFYCFLHYFSQDKELITGCLSLHFFSGKIEMTKQSRVIFLVWSIQTTYFELEVGSQEVLICNWEQWDPYTLCFLSIMHVCDMHRGAQKYFLLCQRHYRSCSDKLNTWVCY